MMRCVVFFLVLIMMSCGSSYTTESYSSMNEFRNAMIRFHKKALQDTTVLVKFNTGQITRRDMVLYGTKNYGLESVVGSVNRTECLLSSVSKQSMLLKEMVERTILLQEAAQREFYR